MQLSAARTPTAQPSARAQAPAEPGGHAHACVTHQAASAAPGALARRRRRGREAAGARVQVHGVRAVCELHAADLLAHVRAPYQPYPLSGSSADSRLVGRPQKVAMTGGSVMAGCWELVIYFSPTRATRPGRRGDACSAAGCRAGVRPWQARAMTAGMLRRPCRAPGRLARGAQGHACPTSAPAGLGCRFRLGIL